MANDDDPKRLQRIYLTEAERQKLLEAAEQADPLSDSQPIPRAIQLALRNVFTPRQLAKIAIIAEETKRAGFGDLVVRFLKHRPKFIEKSESEELE